MSNNDLLYAVRTERFDIIESLLNSVDNFCDINSSDIQGSTALHVCCINSIRSTACDMTYLLLKNGADGTIKDLKGNIPLHYAALYAQDEKIIHILTPSSNPNLANIYGCTPLMSCCMRNRKINIFNALLQITVNINQQDCYGNTALHSICYGNNITLLKCLLSSSLHKNILDIYIQNNNGDTCLDIAKEECRELISYWIV